MARAASAALLIVCAALVVQGCSDPARERFETAEKALLMQKMDAALAGYRSIPKDFPQSRYAPTALLRQGELFGAFYRNYPAALEAYESLVFNYPRAPEAPQALLRQGEVRVLQFFDYAAAAEDFESVRRRYPRFARMDEVLVLLAKAYAGVPDPARQVAALGELIDRYPKSPRAPEARWMLAYALLGQGSFVEADREFRKLYYLSAGGKDTARARWGMAQALEGMGQLGAALAQYEAIRDGWDDPEDLAARIARLRERMRGS